MTADWATHLHDHITLTASEKTQQLLHACQLFAMRFDTYLNAGAATIPYAPVGHRRCCIECMAGFCQSQPEQAIQTAQNWVAFADRWRKDRAREAITLRTRSIAPR